MDSCILVEDISDHLPIILFVEVEHTNIIKSNKVNKHYFTEQNIRHFVTSLQTVDWSSIEITASTKGPDAAYTYTIC